VSTFRAIVDAFAVPEARWVSAMCVVPADGVPLLLDDIALIDYSRATGCVAIEIREATATAPTAGTIARDVAEAYGDLPPDAPVGALLRGGLVADARARTALPLTPPLPIPAAGIVLRVRSRGARGRSAVSIAVQCRGADSATTLTSHDHTP
jgi:hypothetical protein